MTKINKNREYRIRKLWHSDDCTHHRWILTGDELIDTTFERIEDSEVRRYERFGKTVPNTNCEAWRREFGSGLENPPACWELAASAHRSGYELAPLISSSLDSRGHFEFGDGKLACNVKEPPWRGFAIFGDRPRCFSCACVCHRCDEGCASCDCECRACYCEKTCVVAKRVEDAPEGDKVSDVAANAEREVDAVSSVHGEVQEAVVGEVPRERVRSARGVPASAFLGAIWKMFVVIATVFFVLNVLARICGGAAPIEQCYGSGCDGKGMVLEMEAVHDWDIGVP